MLIYIYESYKPITTWLDSLALHLVSLSLLPGLFRATNLQHTLVRTHWLLIRII